MGVNAYIINKRNIFVERRLGMGVTVKVNCGLAQTFYAIEIFSHRRIVTEIEMIFLILKYCSIAYLYDLR